MHRLESDVQADIILQTAHLVSWFRNNQILVGFDQDGRPCPVGEATRVVRAGVGGKGGSDLIGILRSSGRFVACECKVEGKKPTHEQELFLDVVRLCGGLAFVARSVSDAISALEAADGH